MKKRVVAPEFSPLCHWHLGFCDDHLSWHPDTRERHGTAMYKQCEVECLCTRALASLAVGSGLGNLTTCLCTRTLASLTLNSILACQPPAQSAPILVAKWQDDDDNGDDSDNDNNDANDDDNGDNNDDNDDDNDDEARRRCKLFLCKLFPSRHWLLS